MKKILSFGLVLIALAVLTACANTGEVAASTIAIDVNPSVELELDEDGKVINVILNNEDAEIILGDMDLTGVDYNVAINALIGSMIANGYISDLANSVLLSISTGDETKDSELMGELSDTVNQVLTTNHIVGSVLAKGLGVDEEVVALSELLSISKAKADLILDIVEEDPRMIVEELASLSINELNLLLESKNIRLQNTVRNGYASMKNIITEEEAYQNALVALGINELDVVEYELELDQGQGGLIYEVEVTTDTDEYEILIKARNGEVFVPDEDDEDEVFPEEALTEEEVLNLIATELGLDPELISFDKFKAEVDNGIAYYEIEFEYGDEEYELEVDALTGEIYRNSLDTEGLNYNENGERGRGNGKDHEDDDEDENEVEDEENETA